MKMKTHTFKHNKLAKKTIISNKFKRFLIMLEKFTDFAYNIVKTGGNRKCLKFHCFMELKYQ